ncbi:MAG: ATP-binding cassette domain-containing protein, partial [Caldilineaceae bacterium]|nr:ATP-binding cassette domain-containing protein [Caldilineaceae bacterium]
MTLGQQVSARAATNAKIEADDTILEIRDLKTYFFLERGVVKAVDGVDVAVGRKKTLGVVGESGCGKSVTFRSVMRLIQSPPGKIVEGEILLHREDGATVDIVKLDPRSRQLRDIRGAE